MKKAGKFLRGFKCRSGGLRMRFVWIMLAVSFALGIFGVAYAFEIKTGNEDVSIRFDNTVKFSTGYRVTKTDKAIIANPNLDDGNRNFKHGFVTNRFDLLSELDLVYKQNYGLRFSGAAWYDLRYSNGLMENDSAATSNTLDSSGNQTLKMSNYVENHYRGPDAELLDAFFFANFSIVNTPVQFKIGRHTIYWGESLGQTAAANGIAYSQAPVDYAKGYAVPNVSAKELYRPLFSVSASAQPISSLSIAAQYFLQWEASRAPEPGTYYSTYDMSINSGDIIIDPMLGNIYRQSDITPRKRDEWGIMARWSPEILNGATLGLYYREFADRFPQFHLGLDPTMLLEPATVRAAYASNIKLYGISYSTQIFGLSVSGEFSYRENMPLASDLVLIASDATAAAYGLPPGSYRTSFPDRGDTLGARGNTFHGLINVSGMGGKTLLFDSYYWQTEFNWSRWHRVTQNKEVFLGRDGYDQINRVSKDSYNIEAYFAPTWFNVPYPGLQLSLPLAVGYGLQGNSAASGVIAEDAGYYMAGLSLDIFQKHRLDLNYVGYFGQYTKDATGAVDYWNGDGALLKDRAAIYLTFKTTF